MTPTPQQAAFIKALVTTTSNIALVARAGTGKTTTILQGVAAFHEKFPNAEVVVCAFNKAIADEVKDKLKKAGYPWQKVQGSTIHGLGFGLLRSFNAKVDANKVRDMIRARNEVIFQQYGAQINDLVRYAKGAGFGFFDAIGDNAAWYALADHYDVNGLDNTSEMDAVVSAAQDIYRASLAKTDVVDFDDMILFPLVMNIAVKYPKDLIILDEAQDLSKARQALARKFLKPRTGRMIIVGDDRQAIYGFSGADAEALNNLTQELDAVTLPLTVTWRCPKSVIREAQKIVADIECATDNEGEVNRVEELRTVLATDAVLASCWIRWSPLLWTIGTKASPARSRVGPLVRASCVWSIGGKSIRWISSSASWRIIVSGRSRKPWPRTTKPRSRKSMIGWKPCCRCARP